MKIALAQINSTTDVARNFGAVRSYVREAAAVGANIVVFPEATMSAFGSGLRAIARDHSVDWQARMSTLAADSEITIIVGEFEERGEKVVNLLAAYSSHGERTVYAKIHLYDAFGFKESDTVEPGEEPVLIEIGGEKIGLTLCYDVRFPKLYAELSRRGARVTIVAASWGAGQGKVEQWQTLARARALDSNMFIAAVGQADPEVTGVAVPPKVPTGVGHSLVSDPFGSVLTELGGEETLSIIDLDLTMADTAAQTIPVLENAKLGY